MSFSFVDLFAGCGGFSTGMADVGGHGLFAIEKNSSAFASLDSNLGPMGHKPTFQWPSWFEARAQSVGDLIDENMNNLRRIQGQVDVVIGGPPCQGFSTYGRRQRSDQRNRLYLDYLRVVEALMPSIVLLENVQGIDMPFIVSGKETGRHCKSTVASRIEKRLNALGYQTRAFRVCASNFGVPQYRTRFIMLGVRTGSATVSASLFSDEFFSEVRADHLSSLGLKDSSVITSGQALSDLETAGMPLTDCLDAVGRQQLTYRGPKTDYQRQMRIGMTRTEAPSSMRLAKHSHEVTEKFRFIQRLVAPGSKVGEDIRAELGSAKFRTHLLGRNVPSATVTTLPDDLIHYCEPRIPTVRECARLQSFPDWFQFAGPYTSGGARREVEVPRFSQVGNAVPPRLGAFLGRYASAMLAEIHACRVRGIAA